MKLSLSIIILNYLLISEPIMAMNNTPNTTAQTSLINSIILYFLMLK
nr:MAG TPA: hypothetical protein [Bacteriophage sp.]